MILLLSVHVLQALLLRNQIATLDESKKTLGTPVHVTVFRKLKPLDYPTSDPHRGWYYSLRDARFDYHGLWSKADAVLAFRYPVGHRRSVRQSFSARVFRR